MTPADLAVLGRTVAHLRPAQLAHRARLRTQQAGLRRFGEAGRLIMPGPDPAAAVGWPDAARPVDALTPDRWPSLAELRTGKIRLLGLARELGWGHCDAPRLWRFHLHYWDWAWGLATDQDRLAARALFARLWRSWQASAEFGRGDAWHPYPAALRAWSWCGLHRALVAGSDIEPDFIAGLAAHTGFMRRHLEYDVGGNHLVKGLKALAGLAVFFADERLLRLALRRLTSQLARQVLPDGGHYERAPAYHCQVLADLVDVADLLRAAGRTPAGEITTAIARMQGWLGAVLTPDGRVPLLNDGYPVDRELIALLRPGPIPQAPDRPLLVLPATGLVRAVAGGWHLLADVGPPCPPSLPAHAHADTFGCLLHVDKVPLLIDTGTSTYEPGPVRRHERSTAAHSTVQVDGMDSTEVWGVFRAGRRARVSGLAVHADAARVTCEAVHDGFRGLRGRPVHHRRWSLTSDGLRVEDTVTGRGRHEIVIRWQLAAGLAVRVADRTALVAGLASDFSVTVAATTPVRLATETRAVAAGFGSTADAPVLICQVDAALPVGVTTVWSRARGQRGRRESDVKQVVQPAGGGPVEVLEVPRPAISPTEVLVRTVASVISPGTERAVTSLARATLLAKARARPDLVRQVVRKAQADGIPAAARAVRGRLAADVPLGYSAAGVVAEVGAAVDGIGVGQLVATGGAGKASHAEFQAVPGLLCAVVPDPVPPHDAAFATLASIPLHALRLSGAGPGSKVVVLGLGLIGQLAARLAMASGCDVAGIDPDGFARETAAGAGVLALDESGDSTTGQVLSWSRGRGADVVLVCAADKSSGPMSRTPALCRDRAAVVMVGDVGMPSRRAPFYEREISLLFARSYGPGRYEPSYEAWGVDYPAGQVRWTEGRNQEAVLDLLAAGRLRVSDLITQSFGIDRADEAFRLLEERTEPCLAIRLTYPATAGPEAAAGPEDPVRLKPSPADRSGPGVGWIGAGAFSTGTLLPAFRQAGFERFVAVATASGISARRAAERHGFEKAVSGAAAVIDDADVSLVVIATPHDVHAELASRALTAGRDVWCEKPLALTCAGVDEVEKAWRGSGRQLTLGFNRRWAPAVQAAQRVLAQVQTPKLIVYRIAAGRVPDGHWYLDRRQGGRLLGEVCHFVDLAQALVGADIEDAASVLGGDPSQGSDGVAVALRFADGSVASITYGSISPVTGKERIEVLAGSHQVIIDDFRSVLGNGRTLWKGRQDKGHRAHAAAFRQAVRGGTGMPTEAMLGSMRATIQAADRARAT